MGNVRTNDVRDPAALRAEAVRVHDSLMEGNLAIVPLDVAYGIVGIRADAIERIFKAKQRSYDKPSGLFGNWGWTEALHIMPEESRQVARTLLAANLPFSIVAPFRPDHRLLAKVDPFVLEHSSKAGTLDILMNAGQFHNALSQVALEREQPCFGSSANVSLTGSRYRLEDIDARVRDACAIALDHGESAYANALGRSSTILDFIGFKVIRYGVCFDRIAEVLRTQCGIELPADAAAA